MSGYRSFLLKNRLARYTSVKRQSAETMTEENNDRMRMVSRIIMEVYLAEDGLTAKTAVLRVESLLDSLGTLKDKCMKYMFIMQNYVSFYKSKTEDKLRFESAAKAPGFASLSNNFATLPLDNSMIQASLSGPIRKLSDETADFVQPVLRDGGDIEPHEASFAELKSDDSEKV